MLIGPDEGWGLVPCIPHLCSAHGAQDLDDKVMNE